MVARAKHAVFEGQPAIFAVVLDLTEQHQIEVWRPESEAGAVWRERMVWRVPAEAPLVMDLRGVFAG